ncbi:MAG: hypothetical protein Q8N18_07010 [Opitutaceae bacterium]|nr:hypothetical protein [Opitutaceae bacterium]
MELRTLILILGAALGVATVTATPVQRHPLDDRTVYAVRIGVDSPTTVMFPGPITAVEGAGVSVKSDDQPPVLISHQPGSHFFSVRALRPGATAATNVIFRDRVFAFAFTGGEIPDRTITFYDHASGETTPAPKRPGPARLLSLLDRAKNYPALAEQYPALVQTIERTSPGTIVTSGPVTCVIEEVFGFTEEDAIVFRLRLENRSAVPFRCAPAQLTMRVGETRFPSAINDAPEELPAGRAVIVHLALVGNPDGTRANLSVKNAFVLALPLPE